MKRHFSLARMFFGEVPLMTADSINEHPTTWHADPHIDRDGYPYRLHHDSGVSVWIANRQYGIEVKWPGEREWGGVTMLSALGLSPGHWLISIAADRWLKANGYQKGGGKRVEEIEELRQAIT